MLSNSVLGKKKKKITEYNTSYALKMETTIVLKVIHNEFEKQDKNKVFYHTKRTNSRSWKKCCRNKGDFK